MKPIRELTEATPGLADYLELVGSSGDWVEFHSHHSGSAYRELREALTDNQHGLCAYCEIEISASLRQVEHVHPQSDAVVGRARKLDITNMLACCLGGTYRPAASPTRTDESRYLEPVAANTSCGQAKRDRVEASFVDPRTLPPTPTLLKVLEDGNIQPDEDGLLHYEPLLLRTAQRAHPCRIPPGLDPR